VLSLQFIRENPDLVRKALEKRQFSEPLDDILVLDEQRRSLLPEVEALRAKRNQVSKKLGKMDEKPPQLIEEMREIGNRIKALDEQLRATEEQLNDLLLRIPNIPHPTVPLGRDESENRVIRSWGDVRKFDFKPRPHWELGEKLGIIDFVRGAKLSGTRFYVLCGLGAHLQRALISFMLDLHITEHGYTEIYPPFMVKRECMVGSGNLPKFADNLYHDEEDDFWFVPTAEVPCGLHRLLSPREDVGGEGYQRN
jgi:seryl-tRNA synthetase